MENDIATVCGLITGSRNDSGDFIGGSPGEVVGTAGTPRMKTQRDGALVLWWHVPGELKGSLVQLNSWMMTVEHILQNLHGVTKKFAVVLIGHAIVESVGRIINVQLTV